MKVVLYWKNLKTGDVTTQEVSIPGTMAQSGALADAYIRGSKKNTRARLVLWEKKEDTPELPNG